MVKWERIELPEYLRSVNVRHIAQWAVRDIAGWMVSPKIQGAEFAEMVEIGRRLREMAYSDSEALAFE